MSARPTCRLPVSVVCTTVETSRGHIGHTYWRVEIDSVPGEHLRTYDTRGEAMAALDERIARIRAAYPGIDTTFAITEIDMPIRWPAAW